MKIKQTLEFELDVTVTRTETGDVELRVAVDSDGGTFFLPEPEYDEVDDEAEPFEIIPADQIPEGATDEQIVDAYFNSPYGVA